MATSETAYSNAGETTRRRQLREAAVEAFPADESVELGVTRVVGADGSDAPARSLQAGGTSPALTNKLSASVTATVSPERTLEAEES